MQRRRIMLGRWSASVKYSVFSWYFFFSLSFSSLLFCAARDSITAHQPILDGELGETLVSARGRFELGFFTPGNSTNNRYLGIWYHGVSPQTLVWVANRDRPIPNRNGVFTIAGDGNLQILDGERKVVWSTKVVTVTTNTTATLLDSGNLILTAGGRGGGENGNHNPIWQSFVYDERNPSNMFLPGMKLEANQMLRSWIDEYDPAPGAFTFEHHDSGLYQFTINNGSTVYWRSGSSDGLSFLVTYLLSNYSVDAIDYSNGNLSDQLTRKSINSSQVNRSVTKFNYRNTRLVIDPTGRIKFLRLRGHAWELLWSLPNDNCNVHKACGANAVCNANNTPACECLPGFRAQSQEDWDSGNYSGGCTRAIANNEVWKEDFAPFNILNVKEAESSQFEAKNEAECRQECVNRGCKAYSFEASDNQSVEHYSCWIWSRDEKTINGIQVDNPKHRRRKIHVRRALSSSGPTGKQCNENFHWDPSTANCTPDAVNKTEQAHSSRKPLPTKIIVPIAVAFGSFCTAFTICRLRKWLAKRKARRENIQKHPVAHLDENGDHPGDILDLDKFREDKQKGIDVPFFNFKSIAAATENFSDSNKLGQGGFGSVYKGQFPGGHKIAVKRLSKSSGQGLKEFKNEVLLIAKLQHRNLVRLLGYSIKGDERMLLYEYMPNRSLDCFIFDQKRCLLLNWEKRFNIIMGLARGLLYLHHDSRLRIIHRDLKTSNILLDEEMNPKISDFGLARIVEGNQTKENTNRVIGTYGYMSPEYALDGFFSVKSDVFSFGVVLLEIISGMKNTGFYQSEQSSTLLGYAWRLWKEDKALDLMDKSLREPCNTFEVMKCIHVALLCIQDDADDRPTMSNVVFLLGSETANFPIPKQPAYTEWRALSISATSYSRPEICSGNQLTITIEGR
ncbi:PREDICTED: G-type lectin S-receptor-like serine/threonine-protein kinase At4g03230 [Nelumbo nucifera]|uniref:Receptor-like serine/threonine-protein kinase n=2 Tax=Nelumbo nucifera TaxID=4432 RepID=A0A822XND4_NELNU|nr:PREDICTED: G-type lectin S-receptor-like serine/threonine-protein kinase At4g03230 [Nelumbo nucifera]DAD23124.1 TPA_asm: hypothetical protein HUJ06_024587 [Nelumbo nucifera]